MRQESLDGKAIFLLHDFFSAEECDAAIAFSEQTGYEEATITTEAGPRMNKGVRDNSRLMYDDPDLALRLYERARPFLPETLPGKRLVGFNERWRYYRYEVGEKFAKHYDGAFVRDDLERSELTFMIYLNEDFVGGETNFYFLRENPLLSVVPVKGSALVFVHYKLHEGAPVLRGRKYVLRTDVMYRTQEQ